jgi:phosphoglucosamine mutase
VLATGLDVGITFDGDADRALLIDRRGRLVTGDHVLAICAVVRGEKAVVATTMTNLGTERYLAERGITLAPRRGGRPLRAGGVAAARPPAGRRAVRPRPVPRQGTDRRRHPHRPAGAAACRTSGRPLETWMDEIPVYPQSLVNVRVPVDAKAGLCDEREVLTAVAEAEADLAGNGRVNVRPSGTEPLVRVMVEASRQETVDRWTTHVASVVREAAQRWDDRSPGGAARSPAEGVAAP